MAITGQCAITDRVRYHRPARYVRAPVYFPLPAFQIGFAFGGGPTCR